MHLLHLCRSTACLEEFVCTLPGVAAAAAVFSGAFFHVLMSAMSRVAEVLEA